MADTNKVTINWQGLLAAIVAAAQAFWLFSRLLRLSSQRREPRTGQDY